MAGLGNILVVCGPTASGKSQLALELSHRFGGEMVCADSMQLYKGLPIGTAALLQKDAEGVPQHLVGILEPTIRFSVADYLPLAQQTIAEIHARGKLPVVCGGTGQYIAALVRGLRFTPQPEDVSLRGELEETWQNDGGKAVRAQLAAVDPGAAETLHPNDQKRNIRALEAYRLTGQTAAQRVAASKPTRPPYRSLCLAPDYDRAVLYQRINQRVDTMVESGLLQEAQMVYRNKDTYTTAAQAIGYKELFSYFENRETLEACLEKLKQATRNYAKRQLTWFRNMDEVQWLCADASCGDNAARLVEAFLHQNP